MHDAKVCLSMVCVSLRGGRGGGERERGGYVGSNKNTRHTCRPNIVVKECNAYDEDKWRTIIIRDLRYARIHMYSARYILYVQLKVFLMRRTIIIRNIRS
jgi:hypothetical protein